MWLRAAFVALAVTHPVLADVPARPGDDGAAAMTARVDALLEARWKAAGVEPAPPATDAAFLRRASLDLTGAIPSVSEVRAFLAGTQPDRRTRLIESLLRKPTHATRLANHWRDAMLPRNNQQVRFGQAQPFETWLRGKFADNAPYDGLVRELLTATGNFGQVGPTLYYTSLELKAEDLAASTSKIFLGVQISCAQCHNHPFDVWTQRDFWGYAAFFARLQRPPQAQQQFVTTVTDAPEGEVKLPNTETVVAPQFLGAATPTEPTSETRRQQLAAWMTSKDNPYFARAAVNRVWALLFGYGLVNPIDDFGKHNKPVDEALLNELAADFADHGYDLRRLFRILANTRAYGLSSEVTTEVPDDPLLFSRMSVKSLNAEQIWDCVAEATCRREVVPNAQPFQQPAFQINQGKQAFLAKFEAPTQGATEFQAGIPQALTMMNGTVVNDATDLSKSDILAALLDGPFFTNGDRIDILFMAALTRLPTEVERAKFAAYVEAGGPSNNREKALSDVLWALLNSTEFILNH